MIKKATANRPETLQQIGHIFLTKISVYSLDNQGVGKCTEMNLIYCFRGRWSSAALQSTFRQRKKPWKQVLSMLV
jgi:hypothetical protein